MTEPPVCNGKDADSMSMFANFQGGEIPIPLPKDHEPDDYVAQWSKNASPEHYFFIDEMRTELKRRIASETKRSEDEKGDEAIRKVWRTGKCDLRKSHIITGREQTTVRPDTFANKFAHLMHSSSGNHLRMLMDTESKMAKDMANLTKARAWEVEVLTKECDAIVSKSEDLHPSQLVHVNERLKKVHNSYDCQISALIEEQRKEYRIFVEKLCTDPEDFSLPEYDSPWTPPRDSHTEERVDVDESFTIYLGAQLKSMHNVRLVSAPDLFSLCRPNHESKLQTAINLYGRSLSGLILLVKEPLQTRMPGFSDLCEQTTELHFGTHASQMNAVRAAAKQVNQMRSTSSMKVGDVYCTRHSNLQQQVIFHLIVDDEIGQHDIGSRNPVLNAIRNIVRVASRISLTNLYIPLLLIEKPSERTTINWCMRRAEMVFKCVKGYLMEVCGSSCGGSPIETLHYNVHFVVPACLSHTIYPTLRLMITSIFHMVPGVTAEIST